VKRILLLNIVVNGSSSIFYTADEEQVPVEPLSIDELKVIVAESEPVGK